MKYINHIWLYILWLITDVKFGIFGLHVQQAPEIIQRITRQATRYGSSGSINGQSYRPSSTNFNVRNGASDLTTSLTSSQLNSVSSNAGQRPLGVGTYSFGGMASGHPTNGNSFVISNSIKGSGLRGTQPITGQGASSIAGGTATRPQQLQQALLQAAQYQLQHQQQQQQQLQHHQHQQQQQQQLRRQLPQQQLYRQHPVNAYQQYN